jgi:hypothetical protein
LSYVEQVAEVQRLLARPPLGDRAEFVVDETGVGRAVADLFDAMAVKPLRVTITAGDRVTNVGERRWHVPKGVLISTLDARLHTGDLRFAASLTEAGTLADELRDFRRKVSTAGRYSYRRAMRGEVVSEAPPLPTLFDAALRLDAAWRRSKSRRRRRWPRPTAPPTRSRT